MTPNTETAGKLARPRFWVGDKVRRVGGTDDIPYGAEAEVIGRYNDCPKVVLLDSNLSPRTWMIGPGDEQNWQPVSKADEVTVNHPPHYTSHPSGVECITVTEHMNFCRGNAVKYIWRAGEKGNEIEDLKKARWYVDREIARLELSRPAIKAEQGEQT